jgi:FtsH-binding integral membrane protein
MTRNAYRRPPEDVDMAAEERAIRRDSTLATAVTLTGFTAAYWLSPAVADLPTEPADRLLFAALFWAVPCFVLMVAILMVSTARRFSAEDIGGQAAGPPSEKLAIKAAFLQNTLEQTVLSGGFYFALAAATSGAWLALLPVAAIFFVIGRVLFYLRYDRGARGRSLGMALTMIPCVLGYALVGYLMLFGG